MATTIDHLKTDHWIHVLKDFKDARGRQHRAGETGLLKSQKLNAASQEIEIEWEREQVRETLYFTLTSKTGPGNGRMKEYFELGEYAPEPQIERTAISGAGCYISKPKKPSPHQDWIRGENHAEEAASVGHRDFIARTGHRHHRLPNLKTPEILLGERAVACGCAPALHRSVMFEWLAGPGVLRACMNCGTTSCAESRGDDGRFTGEPSTVYFQIAVHDDDLHWLSQWPRIHVLRRHAPWLMHPARARRDMAYLPAKLRCHTPEKLTEKENHLHEQQRHMTLRERIAKCGFPKAPPPAGLPSSFRAFAATWQDLQLTAETDPQHLIQRAQDDSVIAAELLMLRRDALELVINALRLGKLDAALQMLRAAPVPGREGELETVLINIMNEVPMSPLKDVPDRIAQSYRIEVPLLIILEQRLQSPLMLATLRALMRKVARHDGTLVDCIRIVLRELEQPSAT